MIPELVIPSLLQNSAAVVTFVSTRIYPLLLPTGVTLPAISYSVISGVSTPTFNSSGSQRYRIEVNCWGDSYSEAVSLRLAVIEALNRYSDGSTSILYFGRQDLFDHELEQYRAIAEFYLYTNQL